MYFALEWLIAQNNVLSYLIYVMVICDGNLCWCNKQLVMGGGGALEGISPRKIPHNCCILVYRHSHDLL